MNDSSNPKVIGLDIASTFVVVSKFLRGEEEPFTSEDARAISISAHMEASKKGYKSLNPAPPSRSGEEPNVAQEPQGAPQQAPAEGEYDYHNMKHVASQPSKGLLHGVMKAAIKKENEHGKGARDAELAVKTTTRDAFEIEWAKTPDLTSLKNMNQGQVSWTIAYVCNEWGVE